ncbi:hypothetical protein GCM10023094_29200 [Rhodococcus olei]|uniref:Uncharacterized protein n=1 Tax=Rhodococcus olei TaxID=2161675 RepID=A0ABP8P6F7_9NOCA
MVNLADISYPPIISTGSFAGTPLESIVAGLIQIVVIDGS